MKTILVPTDFSEVAVNAAYFAIQIAKKTRSKLLFFHSIEQEEKNARKKLLKELEALRSGGNFEFDFVITDKLFNSMTINELLKGIKIDLIVSGTIGDDGSLQKQMFGTNTVELLDDLRCPLLAIPENCTYTKINKIAYASDLSLLASELPPIVSFARPFDAEIIVLHISPVYPDLGDVEKRNIRKELQLLASTIDYKHLNYHKEDMGADNKVHKGISHFLELKRPDVLVLFHRNQDNLDRFFSSSESEKAVKHFELPLLIFPKNI
jgi:nucleotide-binding universal stress UspA family protein